MENGNLKVTYQIEVSLIVACPGPGMAPLEFKAPYENPEVQAEAEEVRLRLLDIEVTGLSCGPEAASWVSRFLGEDSRLVQHHPGDSTERRTRAKYVKDRYIC